MTERVETNTSKSKRSGSGGVVRRLGPAFALIAVGLSIAIAGEWFFAVVVGVAAVLMLLEWQTMTGIGRNSPTGVLQSATAIAAVGLAAWGTPEAGLAVVGAGSIAAGITARIGKASMAHASAGILYIGIPTLGAIWLRNMPDVGMANILWLYAVVWAGDTGAYAAGKTIGGPRLAPEISPNKTWAGAIGGAVASMAAGLGAAALLGGVGSVWMVLLMAFVIAVASQIGDLAESLFKRSVNVKDSGKLLPGHGGALDRLDGFLAALAMACLIYLIFGLSGTVWSG